MPESNELKSVTIHLPIENVGENYQEGTAAYKSSNVCSPHPKELESLNNVLR